MQYNPNIWTPNDSSVSSQVQYLLYFPQCSACIFWTNSEKCLQMLKMLIRKNNKIETSSHSLFSSLLSPSTPWRLLLPSPLSRPLAGGVTDPGEAARGGEALRPGAAEADVRTGAAAAPPAAHSRETLPPPGPDRPGARRGRRRDITRLPQAHATLERGQVRYNDLNSLLIPVGG